MSETVKITAKTPGSRGRFSTPKTKKPCLSKKDFSPANQILHLQRSMGNREVQRLLKSGTIQAKLKIGQPNDKYEQEADRAADQVMRMPEQEGSLVNGHWSLGKRQKESSLVNSHSSLVQRKSTCPDCPDREEIQTKPIADQITPLVQRQVGPEEEEVQAKQANNQAPAVTANIESGINSIRGGGQPLPESTRSFFEPRFGTDFSQVRLHTDSRAAETAKSINAKAYTIGKDVVFGAGQYSPGTSSGKNLLAHELMHVVQQQSNPKSTVQRDLKAYNTSRTETTPFFDSMGGSTSYIEQIEHSAEAPGLRKALSALISSGKIKEVKSTNGKISWFAAQHHKNVQLEEIRQALKKTGYAEADKLARTIYDFHGEFLYSKKKFTTITPFYTKTTNVGEKIETQTHRSLTEWEIRQAKRVFGNALDYSKVTIADGSILAKIGSFPSHARTVGNMIYCPKGSSRDMAFIIHELTHVWQYQRKGWIYAPKSIWAQVYEGYNYKEKGKTAEQSLKDAREAGKTLYSYNYEQQGDILADYYRRLQQRENVSAWQPFVNDI